MATSATVPVFGPDGQVRDIPRESMGDALKNGGELAHAIINPKSGQSVWVPQSQLGAALQNGGVPEGAMMPRRPMNQGSPSILQQIDSGITAVGSALNSAAASGLGLRGMFNPAANAQRVAGAIQGVQNQPTTGSKIAAAAAPFVNVDANAVQQAAIHAGTTGDYGPLVATGVLPLATAHLATSKVGPQVDAAPVVNELAAGELPEGQVSSKGTVAPKVMPEAAALPQKAVAGAEDVFRAAAPTGGNPGFRSNVYAAAGDLAEIGRKANIAEAKGGIINPDMRVRATVNAINDHLQEMYQNERAPQIERNADAPVQVKASADATEGLKFLARNAGTAEGRILAVKALSQQLNDGIVSLSDADGLARVVNKELSGYESMTPAERAATAATNRRLASLKALDQQLGDSIGTELERRGEPGLQSYERRYAALSQIRNQLQSRMNAVELNQPGRFKGIVRPAINAISGGKTGIASASQAAVADVNIGRTLQNGLQALADSGINANRAVGKGAPPIKGLLTQGATQLGASMEPISPPSDSMPAANPLTRAQRKGLLLQESNKSPIQLPSSLDPITPAGPPAIGIHPALKPLSPSAAFEYVKAARGDFQLAQEIAKRDGYYFTRVQRP